MAKYHINPETGRVNICRAEKRDCPVSGPADHYETKEAAFKGREEKLTEELGTFSAVSKPKSGAPTEPEPVYTPEMARAASVYYEYGLNETWRKPEDDADFIERVAAKTGLELDFMRGEVARLRARDAEDFKKFEDKYNARVEEVAAATPETIKRGSIIAVRYDRSTVRLMKVASIRRGIISGPTVEDGEYYEPLYMEDVDAERSVIRTTAKPEPVRSTATLKADEKWNRIPGEGMFKTIRDENGEARGSIQLREGFYILGARELKTHRRDEREITTGRLVRFENNQFENEEQAIAHLNEWMKKNPSVKLSD